MSLDDIEIFAKVVQLKSFTRAAESLRLPKSTVSRRISTLEDHLRVKLLNRTTRQLSLTPVGEAYFEKCLEVLERLEDANALISGLQSVPRGRLRLTIPHEFGITYLQPLITSFMETYKEVVLELEFTNRIVDIIEEGFDLAIRIGGLEDSSLMATKLGTIKGGVYASPEFLKENFIPSHPFELPLDKCFQFKTGQTQSWIFQDDSLKILDIKPQGRIQANSMVFICEAALRGLGFASLNSALATPYVQEGRLIQVLDRYTLLYPDVHAVYPSRKYLSPPVRAFIDLARPFVAQLLG